MTGQDLTLDPGLYLVSTPIGNARDITLRALDVLTSADVLAAEDTRSLRKLMTIHGISLKDRPLVAYHDHSRPEVRDRIAAAIAGGRSVAYCSEAGTPLVSDPGFGLVRSVRDAGGAVTAVPGASAVLAALAVSGLPTDRFLFLGFLPASGGARRQALAEVAGVRATLVIYETPKRALRTISDLVSELGAERDVALCRELTKKFEEVATGRLGAAADMVSAMPQKGEMVLLIGPGRERASEGDLTAALAAALETASVKDAVRMVADDLNLPRRAVYQAALKMEKGT